MDQELKQYLDDKFADLIKKEDAADFARRTDLADFATKSDLADFARRTDLVEFATRQDFRTLETKLDTLQETLNKIDRRDKDDSNAFAKDIIKHDMRITKLENDVSTLKLHTGTT
ncbi:MAG: hypothetical protein JNK33_00860 [Candidatus Doudnabacteria bacterium]|nr:hypothetical protein [Candidatus Doudnabacteria bacterium]